MPWHSKQIWSCSFSVRRNGKELVADWIDKWGEWQRSQDSPTRGAVVVPVRGDDAAGVAAPARGTSSFPPQLWEVCMITPVRLLVTLLKMLEASLGEKG